MTLLEIILIAIIWISYGSFASYNTKNVDDDAEIFLTVIYIILAPAILVIKATHGIFKEYRL